MRLASRSARSRLDLEPMNGSAGAIGRDGALGNHALEILLVDLDEERFTVLCYMRGAADKARAGEHLRKHRFSVDQPQAPAIVAI